MRLLTAVVLITASALPAAADYWKYSDWHVSVETIDTGEDLRINCYAHTGGDGDPVWALEVSNGDAGPPDYFPVPRLIEIAPSHNQTIMKNKQTIEFKIDSGRSVLGKTSAYINDEGFFQAEGQPLHNSVFSMLISMRRGHQIEAQVGEKTIATASLNGFSAAYGKMMDECGFPLAMN